MTPPASWPTLTIAAARQVSPGDLRITRTTLLIPGTSSPATLPWGGGSSFLNWACVVNLASGEIFRPFL